MNKIKKMNRKCVKKNKVRKNPITTKELKELKRKCCKCGKKGKKFSDLIKTKKYYCRKCYVDEYNILTGN